MDVPDAHEYQGKPGDLCTVESCGLPERAGVHLVDVQPDNSARIIITKLPTGDFSINSQFVTPVEMVGVGEILKGMGLGMIQAGTNMQSPKRN